MKKEIKKREIDKEWPVQPIPFGTQFTKFTKIVVTNLGNIYVLDRRETKSRLPDLKEEKKSHTLTIEDAISQQGDILSHYLNTEIGKLKHKGQISKLEQFKEGLDSLLESAKIHNHDLEQIFGASKEKLDEILEKQKNIVEAVLKRMEYLIEERDRCERIIGQTMNIWSTIGLRLCKLPPEGQLKSLSKKDYDYLITILNIPWNDFFSLMKQTETVRVNPYRERTQSLEVKSLGKLYKLIKERKINEAIDDLFKAIQKTKRICPKELNWVFDQISTLKSRIKLRIVKGQIKSK